MFNFNKHKSIMLQILKDIYSDVSISSSLGFKGGTAAYLFYGLDRNSVDLDFDLLDENKKEEVFEKINKIISQYGKITDSKIKHFNLLSILSYESGLPQIKIEINMRQFGSKYENLNILGIPMLVMNKEEMFAHKVMAMYERIGKTSRDIYDIYFFGKNGFGINKEIVENRSGKSFEDTIEECIELVENIEDKNVLDGLGELLTEGQKDWARAKMKKEVIFQLNLLIN